LSRARLLAQKASATVCLGEHELAQAMARTVLSHAAGA